MVDGEGGIRFRMIVRIKDPVRVRKALILFVQYVKVLTTKSGSRWPEKVIMIG